MGRVRRTDLLAGAGGVVLLTSLFLDWYGFDPGQGAFPTGWVSYAPLGIPASVTAWQAFSVTDLLLALAALLAIGVPVSSALAARPAKPVAFTVLASLAGGIATLLVLYRLVAVPGGGDVGLEAGAWVGLGGALLTCIGSWRAMADEHTPGAVAPDLPRRPVPAPESNPAA